jgi:hypothetical protein
MEAVASPGCCIQLTHSQRPKGSRSWRITYFVVPIGGSATEYVIALICTDAYMHMLPSDGLILWNLDHNPPGFYALDPLPRVITDRLCPD